MTPDELHAMSDHLKRASKSVAGLLDALDEAGTVAAYDQLREAAVRLFDARDELAKAQTPGPGQAWLTRSEQIAANQAADRARDAIREVRRGVKATNVTPRLRIFKANAGNALDAAEKLIDSHLPPAP